METTAMTGSSSALERKAWSRVMNDGLWDLYLGALFANAAAWMTAAELGLGGGINTAVPISFLIVFLGAFRQAKAKITEPRIGYFKIAASRTRKVSRTAYLSVGVTVLLVGVTFVAGITGVPEGIPLATLLFGVAAVQFVLLLGLAAYVLGVRRFYAYATFMAAGYVTGEILAATTGIAHGWDIVAMFGLPAFVMLPAGGVLLRKFLSSYPLPEGGETKDGQTGA